MINFIASVLVAVQLLIGSVTSQLLDLGIQENHRLWLEIQEPCFSSVYDDDTMEYEDEWTVDLFVYLVKLSTGTELLVLGSSEDEVWNKVEKKLWEKGNMKTSILQITKDEW